MRTLILTLCLTLSNMAFSGEFAVVSKSDIKMNHAFAQAKASLDSFLILVNKGLDDNAIYGAYVKFDENGETEYLWVTDVQKYSDEYYIGVVISKPRFISRIKYGDTIGYKVSDIYDWQHHDKGQNITHGAFTTCALLNPELAQDLAFIKENGLQCER